MSRRKNLQQSNWLIELSPRKNVEPRIVGIISTFRGSTFFRIVEILLQEATKIDLRAVIMRGPLYNSITSYLDIILVTQRTKLLIY